MEYRLFLTLSPIAATILLFTFTATWKYRREEVGRCLLWYFTLVILFLVTNLFELLSRSESWTLFWAKAQHPVIAFLPVAWITFALNYSGINTYKKGRPVLALTIVPLVTSVSVFLYPAVKLYYESYSFVVIDGYSTIDPVYGIWFWINGAYMYVLLIFGVVLIIRYIFSKRSSLQMHALWIVSGIFLPIIVNFLYILPLPVFTHKDYTPLAFALSGIFFFVDIYWFRLLQIIPIARNVAIEEMETGILILDGMRNIVDCNTSVLDMFSLSRNIIGKPVGRVPALKEIIRDPIPETQIIYEAAVDGNAGTRNCDVFIKVIRNPQHEQLGVLVTINDVTLRVKLIEEKMKLVTALQNTNRELKSTQLQLIHREKLASIGQVSAGVAHELRNPLSFLQSNYRVLKSRLLELEDRFSGNLSHEEVEEIREMLVDSEDGFRRILDVVNNLLQFSSPVDTSNAKKAAYNLHTGLDNTLKIVQGLIKNSARIDKEYGNIPHIHCYKSEINQVFLNILTNAVHAINGCLDRQGLIRIRTWQDDGSVHCDISNNGPPIEPEIRERIFEPFYTTKQSGKGTGLGLSIAWDIIVKRHNGHISVTSDVHTTVFSIVLPVAGE